MAQDIRKLFEEERNVSNDTMSKGHEARFMDLLEAKLPEKSSPKKRSFSWIQIAASFLVLFGLSFSIFKMLKKDVEKAPVEMVETPKKTLEDVAPDLKKVEDYYVASINFQLSKLKPTPETKELFDGYLERLDELNKEYERLSQELIEFGPSDLTVDALIDNLKLRLNLLNRLKDKVNEIQASEQTPGVI